MKSLPDTGKAHKVLSSGQQIFIIVFSKSGQSPAAVTAWPSGVWDSSHPTNGARETASPCSQLLRSKQHLC